MGDALTWQAHKTGIGVWEPQWLGDQTRYLYASLHRSAVPGARLAVLLVPPLFHEQPRSRRLLTEVASGLAAIGLPSMRFDFFGTADSAGNSDQTDFTSMCTDLEVAANALRTKTGVDRVAVLAWRGAALPVARWLNEGGTPAVVILWEPIVDGAEWLNELKREDAAERCSPDRYRMGPIVPALADERQLMGLAVSQRLCSDIAAAHLTSDEQSNAVRYWAVLRPATPTLALSLEQIFDLPPDSPTFGGSTRMDSGLFVTPPLKRVADELGRALLEVR
ncbi:MAG: hypothetical protein ACREPE_01950 [Lysobacter sp.]